MHDVYVVLARARVRCVSSARVSVGCAHTHAYCSLRYDYVEREEVGLRRSLVDGSLLLARTSFLEERAFRPGAHVGIGVSQRNAPCAAHLAPYAHAPRPLATWLDPATWSADPS